MPGQFRAVADLLVPGSFKGVSNSSFTCMGVQFSFFSVFGELGNRSFTCMGAQLCYLSCFS